MLCNFIISRSSQRGSGCVYHARTRAESRSPRSRGIGVWWFAPFAIQRNATCARPSRQPAAIDFLPRQIQQLCVGAYALAPFENETTARPGEISTVPHLPTTTEPPTPSLVSTTTPRPLQPHPHHDICCASPGTRCPLYVAVRSCSFKVPPRRIGVITCPKATPS